MILEGCIIAPDDVCLAKFKLLKSPECFSLKGNGKGLKLKLIATKAKSFIW